MQWPEVLLRWVVQNHGGGLPWVSFGRCRSTFCDSQGITRYPEPAATESSFHLPVQLLHRFFYRGRQYNMQEFQVSSRLAVPGII
jgi:hypothetical protein